MDIIELDVGGEIVKTTKTTLNSMDYFRAKLERWNQDKNDKIFVDEDKRVFEYILNLVRYGNYPIPEEYREIVYERAQFYGCLLQLDCEDEKQQDKKEIEDKKLKIETIDFTTYSYTQTRQIWHVLGPLKEFKMLLLNCNLSQLRINEKGFEILFCNATTIDFYFEKSNNIYKLNKTILDMMEGDGPYTFEIEFFPQDINRDTRVYFYAEILH